MEGHALRHIFQPFQFQLGGGFLFGLFFPGDLFAQFAGMLAVKGFRDGLLEGFRAHVVRQHRRPRHRLQRHPMRARRAEQRDYQQEVAQPVKHSCLWRMAQGKSRNPADTDTIILGTNLFLSFGLICFDGQSEIPLHRHVLSGKLA